MTEFLQFDLPGFTELEHGKFSPKAPIVDGFVVMNLPGLGRDALKPLHVEKFEASGINNVTVARSPAGDPPLNFKMPVLDRSRPVFVERLPLLRQSVAMLSLSQVSGNLWELDKCGSIVAWPDYLERALQFLAGRSLREAKK